jgi:probable dihydroxyacetone kinase regulator
VKEAENMLKTAKDEFAESLKMMLEKTTLDHIMVKDIVENCGVSRQAFYYHFNDIYGLLEWIYIKEANEALADNCDIDTWQRGYCKFLSRLREDKPLVMNTYRSIRRDYLETFAYNVLFDLFYQVVESQAEGMKVAKEHKEFIARFYSLAFIAIAIDWVRAGMKEEPEAIVEQVAVLVKGDFQKALQKYAQ